MRDEVGRVTLDLQIQNKTDAVQPLNLQIRLPGRNVIMQRLGRLEPNRQMMRVISVPRRSPAKRHSVAIGSREQRDW